MKKRIPDNIDNIFRDKFSDFESEPFSDTKEKIFTDFYSERSKISPGKKIFRKIFENKYLIAACFSGIGIVAALFFLLGDNSRNEQISIQKNKSVINEREETSEVGVDGGNTEITVNKTEQDRKSYIIATVPSPEVRKKSRLVKHKTEKDRLSFYLPDSSKLFLNKYSEISYTDNFEEGKRIVNMSGEVYFDVKRNKDKPFVVYTHKGRIEVLGTSFNVRSLPDAREEVIVESGKVLFAENSNPEKNKIILTPGMKGFLETGKPITGTSAVRANDLSWKTRKLVFNKTPMTEVIKEVEVYFEVRIRLTDPKIFNCNFSGKFDQSASVEEVLETLALSLNGSYEFKNQEYIFTSKGCN